MDTPSPNRPQCSRIITASPLASPSSNPEAAFSSRDTLVHNFEIALRRQGPLSACGKMAKPILPTIHSPDLPPRIAGSSLPRDFETEESRALGAQSRKTSTPSLTASTSSPFSASSPHTPSHESYTYTSSTYTSPVLTTRRSPITRSRSGSHASTSYTYSISTSPTIHTALALPIGQKVPKWREGMGYSLSQSTYFDEMEETEADQMSSTDYYRSRQPSTSTSSPPRADRRAPVGPRPMLRTPPRSSLAVSTLSSSTLTVGRRTLRGSGSAMESEVGLGLGFDCDPAEGTQEPEHPPHPSSSPEPQQPHTLRAGGTQTKKMRAYRERRKAIDFGSQSQLSVDALSISLVSSEESSPSPRSGSGRGSGSSDESEMYQLRNDGPGGSPGGSSHCSDGGQELVVRASGGHGEEDGEWTRGGPTTAQIDKVMREVEEELFSYRSSYHEEGGWRISASASRFPTSASEHSLYSELQRDHKHLDHFDEDEEEDEGDADKLEEVEAGTGDVARDESAHAGGAVQPSRTSVDSVNSEVYTVPPYPNSPPHYQTQFPHLAVSNSDGNVGGVASSSTVGESMISSAGGSMTTNITVTSSTTTTTATTTPTPLRTHLPERHPAHPVSPKSPIALPTLTVLIPGRDTTTSSSAHPHPPPSLPLPPLPPSAVTTRSPSAVTARSHSPPSHPPPTHPLPPLPGPQRSPVSVVRLETHTMPPSSSPYENNNVEELLENVTTESYGGERSAFDSDSDEDGSTSGRHRRFGSKFFGGHGGGHSSHGMNGSGSGNGSGNSLSIGMGRLRKAIRSSVSMEGVGGNLSLRKGRLSFVGSSAGPAASASTPALPSTTTTTSTTTTITTTTIAGERSVTDSPESMSSLRARQITSSSSGFSVPMGMGNSSYSRNGQCPPTTDQGTSLSPIPATPLDMIPPTSLEEELSKVDWKERRKTARSLDHADVQEEEEGEESELPTPVTPAVERTKSFIAALARLPNSPLTVTIPAVPSIPRMLPPPPMLLPKHPRLSSLPSPPMALPMHPRLSSLPSHFTPHTPASSHPDSATTPRPPFDLPLPPPPQEFFRRPSVQAQVDLLVLKASGSAPPDLPLPPTPAAPMKLSAEALQKQTELERLDIDKWRAQVLAEAEAERAIEEEREREEERARVQARIRLEQEELEQVLAVEDRERERVRERDRNAERQGRGEEYMNRLTVVDPEESMVKLEMSMAKLEAYAPAPAQKEEVKGASETVQVIPIDISRESSILSPSPRPPPNTPNTPNSVSTSRTSSKLHHETSSKPTVPPKDSAFVKRIRPRQAKSSAPPTSWMPEGPTPSSSSTSGGLALPKFDFEAPDHKVLDIRGLGLRAESRLGYRPSVEDVPEVPPEAPTQDQQNDEELDHEPVLLVPLRRRPSCLPDLRTNASLVSIDDTGISSTYSTISAGTAAEAQRAKSLKLKDTKLKVRKLFGRIAERTESIREKVPQVALQNPFGHGQQTKFL